MLAKLSKKERCKKAKRNGYKLSKRSKWISREGGDDDKRTMSCHTKQKPTNVQGTRLEIFPNKKTKNKKTTNGSGGGRCKRTEKGTSKHELASEKRITNGWMIQTKTQQMRWTKQKRCRRSNVPRWTGKCINGKRRCKKYLVKTKQTNKGNEKPSLLLKCLFCLTFTNA